VVGGGSEVGILILQRRFLDLPESSETGRGVGTRTVCKISLFEASVQVLIGVSPSYQDKRFVLPG
jgi:hypothetical protein